MRASLLQCLLLAVISTSKVFCRPSEGDSQHTSFDEDFSSSSDLTRDSDSHRSSSVTLESDVDSKETSTFLLDSDGKSEVSMTGSEKSSSNPSSDPKEELVNQPKESDEDYGTLPIHDLEQIISGLEQSMGDNPDDSDVTSDESPLRPPKDSDESISEYEFPDPSNEEIGHRPTPLHSKKDSESDHSFREALIEDLKSRILQKLHLPSPPSDVSPFDLPHDVVRLMHREEDDSRSREEENLIVHPSNSDFNSTRPSCRRLEFNITTDLESVLSLQAWVHKRSSNRLTLSVYSSSEIVATIKEDPRKVSSEAGWVMFELPTMSLIEATEGVLQCIVEAEGGIDTEGANSPFLVVRKYIETPERKKRNARNESGCTCCTENHYITIKDLGWQNWVISPAGFDIKTCVGQCEENRSSYTINYQRIISTLYKINKSLPKPQCSFWAPSCKPDSYLPQRIMYLHENGTVHDHLLPNMLIGSCRCL